MCCVLTAPNGEVMLSYTACATMIQQDLFGKMYEVLNLMKAKIEPRQGMQNGFVNKTGILPLATTTFASFSEAHF